MNSLHIITNNSPTIFSLAGLEIRWYSLLFALGFILGQPLGYYIFKREGKSLKDIDAITLHLILGTVIGARLGHVLFYDFAYYSQHPLEAILPISFTAHGLRFIGYRGLASHGAVAGITLALYIYLHYHIKISLWPPKLQVRKQTRPGQSYLWLVDRIVILVALGGCFIRMGNFMNEEILGKPTQSTYGVVFTHGVGQQLLKSHRGIDSVKVRKRPGAAFTQTGHSYPPVDMIIQFKKSGFSEHELRRFLEHKVKNMLAYNTQISQHIYEPAGSLSYELSVNDRGAYVAHIATAAIPRHPAQLYESLSCLLLFFILFLWWYRAGVKLRPGSTIGFFFVYVFGLRFFYEFIKEGKVVLGSVLPWHVGQWLSIPLVFIGTALLWHASRQSQHSEV
ncbi:MAG: prolipoprotein diacylglyceryl transferase [Bacteroidota bacterium]